MALFGKKNGLEGIEIVEIDERSGDSDDEVMEKMMEEMKDEEMKEEEMKEEQAGSDSASEALPESNFEEPPEETVNSDGVTNEIELETLKEVFEPFPAEEAFEPFPEEAASEMSELRELGVSAADEPQAGEAFTEIPDMVDLEELFSVEAAWPAASSSDSPEEEFSALKAEDKDNSDSSDEDEGSPLLAGAVPVRWRADEYPRSNPVARAFSYRGIPTKILVAAICLLTVAVVINGAILLHRFNFLTARTEQERREGIIFLNNGIHESNSNNFIHHELAINLGDNSFNLRRMSFDNRRSVFFFDRDFDFSNLDIWLVDSFGQSIGLDAAFVDQDGQVLFPDRSVRFDPFISGTRGFVLGFTDLSSGEEIALNFEFTHLHGFTPETSFERIVSIRDHNHNIIGSVQGATFASTGSHLYFTLDSPPGGGLRFDSDFAGSALQLFERGREIQPIFSDVSLYERNGGYLGRMDFRPINHLPGVVDMVFSRVFADLPINQRASAAQLFNNLDPENFISFEVGGYTVVLERILVHVDSTLRLVLHAFETNAEVEGPDDRSNRREVLLDSHLLFAQPDGSFLVLNATGGQSRDVGANVFFDPRESPYFDTILTAVFGGHFHRFYIVANDALIRIEDISIRLDMDQLADDNDGFKDHLRVHFSRENADRERYSVAVLAYERLGSNHRALVREIWYEANGVYHIVTREIYGQVGRFMMNLEENTILHRSEGLFRSNGHE